MKTARSATRHYTIALAAIVLSAITATASAEFPAQSDDGLTLIDSKKADAVYVLEGASLAPYTKVKILDCFVAFKKDYMKDYNRDQIDLSRRISTKDMDRIKAELADEFKREFTKVLSEKGDYAIVEETGEDVLLLRPAIVNLDVAAPDTMSSGFDRTYVTSAGSMVLYIELYDSATSAIIARVIDQQEDRMIGRGQEANRVTNKAAADRILRSWAEDLHDAMAEAHAKPAE